MATVSRVYWTTRTDGSAARELISDQEYQVRRQREQEEAERRKRLRSRNQVRARRQAKYNTLRVAVYLSVVTAFLLVYVSMQASVTTSMKQAAALQSEIATLRAQNSASRNRMNAGSNLEAVKEKAQKSLGMVYADSSQIVYYTMEDTDYMDQY